MPIEYISNRQQVQNLQPVVAGNPIHEGGQSFLTLKNFQRADFISNQFERVPATKQEVEDKLSDAYKDVFYIQEQGEGQPVTIALKEGKGLQDAADAIKAQFKSDLETGDSGMLGKIWAKFRNFAGNVGNNIKQFFGTEGRPLGMLRTKSEVEAGDGKTKTVYHFKLTSGGENKGAGAIQVKRRSYSKTKNFFAQAFRWTIGLPFSLAYYAFTGKSLLWQYTAKGQLHNKALKDAESLKQAISDQVKDIVVMNKNGLEEKLDAGQVGSLQDFLHLAYNKSPEQIRTMVREELKNHNVSFLNKSQATKIDEKRSLMNPLRWISWAAPEWLVSSKTAEGKDASRLADKVADQIADGIIEGIAQGHIHLIKEVISDQKSQVSAAEFQGILEQTKTSFDTTIKESANITKLSESNSKLDSRMSDFQEIKAGLSENQALGIQNKQMAERMVDSFIQDIQTCKASLKKVSEFVEEVSVENLPDARNFRTLDGINEDLSKILASSDKLGSGELDEALKDIASDLTQTGSVIDASKNELLEIHHTALQAKIGELKSSLVAAKEVIQAEREVLADLKNGTTKQTIDTAFAKIKTARESLADKELNPMNRGEELLNGIAAFQLRLESLERAIQLVSDGYNQAPELQSKAAAISENIRQGGSLTDLVGGRNDDWNNLCALNREDAKNLAGLHEGYGFKSTDLDSQKNLETFQSNVVAASLGLPSSEEATPALLKLFTPQTGSVLDGLKEAAKNEGFSQKLGTLNDLSKKEFSHANALEIIKTAESMLPDPTQAAELAKIFASGEQFVSFFHNHADWKTATLDLRKSIESSTIPNFAKKLGFGPCDTPNQLLEVFLKLPQIGSVSAETQQSIRSALDHLGNLKKPTSEALATINKTDLQTLKQVAHLLGNDGVYSQQDIAAIEAQIQASNLVATLSSDLVQGERDGLKNSRITDRIKAGLEVSSTNKEEFSQINEDLDRAVDNFLDCREKIELYTAKLDAHAASFASIVGKNSGIDGVSLSKEDVLGKINTQETQENLRQINRMTTAFDHFKHVDLGSDMGQEPVDAESYFKGALAGGNFKILSKEPYIQFQSYSELRAAVIGSKEKKARLEFQTLSARMQDMELQQKAFSTLQKTLAAPQRANYRPEALKALFDPPVGDVAKIRDVNEARKRLITNTELTSNYGEVSDQLKKSYANRFEALKETGQAEAVQQMEEELSPEAVKTLFKENPAKLGAMIRTAESAQFKSKDFWKNSFFMAELSDSSAKLARFNLLTLENGKLGLFEKIKKNLLGINPREPAIQGQVKKFIASYPGLNKDIAALLSNQELLSEKKSLLPKIDNQLDSIISRRDNLVAEGGRLMARHATALAVAELWRDQRVESSHFQLDVSALTQKLESLGVDSGNYPDLKLWITDLKEQGVAGWLDSQSKDIPKCQSELAENHKRITEDMAKIGEALEKEIDQLQKAGEDIVKNNLRFTSANCKSLESAGLLSSLNHDLFKVSPLNAQLGLDALFGRLNRDIFAKYGKEMNKPNSMTLRLKTGLAEMNAVYNQCRDNDSRLADPRELPMLTFEKVVELRARLDQAANAIENGELSKHKFTRLGGADPRQQLKEALTKTDPDWPRTPLQEMKLLISQRLDRLEARALAKQADLDALGSRLVEQEELEVMLGSEFGDDDNVLVSEDLRQTERRNIMFNQQEMA
jgi:hypothetical protein